MDPTLRSIISPITAVTFTAVATTGLLMLGDVGGHRLNPLHEMAGIAFAATGGVHLVLNWRAFTGLFRHRRAIVACGVATALSIALLALGLMFPEPPSGQRPDHGHGAESGLRMR